MSSAVEERSSKQYSEIPDLGVENGLDSSSLAYATPFRPASLGLKRTPDEDNLLEVLRDEYDSPRPTVRQLSTMRRLDGHARALYRLLTLPIRASLTTAVFTPANDGEEEAEFIEAVFRTAPANGGMTNTFQRFMSQVLGALFEGFSCHEKVFWIPDRGPLKGKVTLKKLAFRPAETITFVADTSGGFAGVRQRSFAGGKSVDTFIDPEYVFYYAAQEDERKFYGVSFFESAFPHYDAKAKAYFTAHLAAQRAAVGTRVGTVPPNASVAAKNEFKKNLSNLALAQWMMVPDGFKVDVLREAGSFDFLNLINHHNHMMSESVLANFFDKDSGGGSGESGALVNFAQPGDDMFILMLRAVMDDIANSINHYIIPQLIDYNFKGSKYPTFTWGTFTDEQRQAIARTFDRLATAGQSINTSPEFMRELEKTQAAEMGLTIDWEVVEAREAEEKAAQAAMDAGMLGGGPDGGDEAMQAVAGAPAELTDEELDSAVDLSSVLALMARRAEQVAGVTGETPAEVVQGVEDIEEEDEEDEEDEEEPVKLTGITEDMMDWASHMVAVAERDEDAEY